MKKNTDQLDIAYSVDWHGNAMWREDCNILRRALGFEDEVKSKKEDKKDMDNAG